jgi:hypothetical protein
LTVSPALSVAGAFGLVVERARSGSRSRQRRSAVLWTGSVGV